MITAGLLFLFFTIFLVPSLRINFEKKGIRVYWNINMGFKLIYELEEFTPYNLISNITSVFPSWWPTKMLYISGAGHSFMLGVLFTRKKESLALLAEKVKPNVADEDAQNILRKYRRQSK